MGPPKGGGPNPEKVGPEGWSPDGWSPEGWEAQNFALFFPSSRHNFLSSFFLLVRRLVARTMSQQLMEVVQSATSPFRYAMATRAGCECISHVLQGLTEMNPNATILSVDGLSACDTILRSAMLQGLSKIEGGQSALPFVSMFYGSPSQSVGGRTGSHAHGPPR